MLVVTYTTKTLTFGRTMCLMDQAAFDAGKWRILFVACLRWKTQFSIIKNGTAGFMNTTKTGCPTTSHSKRTQAATMDDRL